ncbi:translation initiation factor eIF2B subunit [Suhomyces tanzawaensis NRRL Y-17324]|uniref:Translation initiation factor eIF2B subunit gamma n=1 Tax=Suhomyces tanzawaensis NRRL Y-17324 TaxID=984487 RepID=A0A1E4SKB2_9ASCO|nr:translation initiation factor eIF2B subunit [Suhomyces tanzawaensis NRRL Y-17324]ODV79955.1 translation initiation factor eIF2B subunit [Suhomyces tanzawaensis NRRL Y-17324]
MEFQAILLCGKGKALTPFSQARSSGAPKALLPIANRPMIEYVLEWCEKAFFPKVTIVTDSESKDAIDKALTAYKEKAKALKAKNAEESTDDDPEYVTNISTFEIDSENSGEILYALHKNAVLKPNAHFVLLPCDLITNLPPQVLIEAYRNKEDSDIGLLVHYRNQLDIEDKKSKIFPKNYTVYAELADGKNDLLDFYSTEDIDFHQALQIRTQMCWRYPKATISTKLLNSSIFFGSQEIFKVFEENPEKFNESYFQHRSITKVIRDLARRSWRHVECKETIGFLIIPHQATFFRANNIPVLMEANRHFMKLQAITKAQQGAQAKDKLAANVGIDSLIGENTTLGEKTNVKRTVVGKNCTIGKRVKLTGSLVLDNVTIEDDAQLENCIIGHGVVLRSKVKLTNCNVESTHEVAKGTQAKNETLLCFTLEGLVEGDNSVIDDSLETDSDDDSDSEYDDEAYDEYGDNEDGLFAY